MKRKKWTFPGIGKIQSYWWKRFVATQNTLTCALDKMKVKNEFITVW